MFYATLYYLLAKLLFPEDIAEYKGYEQYFISRRHWFFGLLAATFLADCVDTALKGSAYLHSFGIEYPLRLVLYLILCAAGMFLPKRRIQLTVLSVSLVYQVSFIVRHYNTQ